MMEAAQEAANIEEKSSAGDKYETARAMNQLQKDMLAGQLQSNRQELAALLSIDCSVLKKTVTNGACIQTKGFIFFIAAGLGKQLAGGKDIIFLSAHAPLALSLLNKKAGDGFLFNKGTATIESIF